MNKVRAGSSIVLYKSQAFVIFGAGLMVLAKLWKNEINAFSLDISITFSYGYRGRLN
jgi:hypothetical protein